MKRPTEIPLRLQQRINIHFAQKMGVPMNVMVKAIQYVFGEHALTSVQIRHWYKLFQNGRTQIVDLPRKAKMRTGRTPANIQAVKDVVSQDKHVTISSISFQTGIPWSTCRKIVRLDLDLVKKSAKFVPHLLTEDNMRERLRISTVMLQRLDKSLAS